MGLADRFTSAWRAFQDGGQATTTTEGEGDGPGEPAEQLPRPRSAAVLWGTVVLVAILSLFLFSWFAHPVADPVPRSTIFSVTIMLAAAATAVGGLLGFLFGIPRSA